MAANEANGDDTPPEQRYHEEIGETQWKLSLRSLPELKRASSRAELAAVALLDALDLDDRPTFAVDVSATMPYDGPLGLLYCNPALVAAPDVLAKVRGRGSPGVLFADSSEPHAAFKRWLWGMPEETDLARRGKAYVFGNYLWSATAVEKSRLVSGLPAFSLASPEASHRGARLSLLVGPREHGEPKHRPQMVRERPFKLPSDAPADSKRAWQHSPTDSGASFDYTLHPPPVRLSEHLQYFRSIDWSQTPLGPMRAWSSQLRCVVNMMMNGNFPAVLFWGDSATMIYNEPYIQLISLMHPCMGQSARVAAREYWPHFQPLIDHINATGQTLSDHDMPLFLDRHGFLEETFFSFQITPVLDDEGHVAGYYQPLTETTKNNLLERRVSSLVEIGSQTAKARNLETYWELVLNTLALNGKDAPFALLYAPEHQSAPDMSSVPSPGSLNDLEECVLKGAIGVQSDHPIAPPVINMKEASSIFHPYLVQATKSRKPVVLHFDELDVPDTLLASIDWKGYGDPCRCLVICPILPTTSELVQGFLILGVNPRRPFDEDYQQFVHVMLRLLATSLASVVLFEEEMRQKEVAIGQAARIQEQLLAELQMKEKKFQRFAERSDVAIFIMDPAGRYSYRNQRWFDLFDAAAGETDAMGAWSRIVFPEDIPKCENLFSQLAVDKTPICFELRTSMPWAPDDDSDPECKSQQHFKWILCSSYPELDADNELVEIVGNVTDISRQKWAEGIQKMRIDSALQSKRHLEHFIDTTSHEMRNPLSAIMQCADGILSSGQGPNEDFSVPSPASYVELLEQTMDAAQTIAQCAQHMKRIVDDILTVSKLDSGLLIITPIDAQPEAIVRHAVKMFKAEAKAAGVDMGFHVEPSYRALGVDWVSLDLTRVLQVLINLITNALKFTRLEATRNITVSIAAGERKPASVAGGVQFIETKLVADDAHLKEDWKQGPTLYIQFTVADSGRGLGEEERTTLFARFSQASPRTHIHYGGSGLGLFISRRLTEMQGGAIGLASEYKKGSTFSFYIKVRKTTAMNGRRGSVSNVFPEDMRHRATTRKEIDELQRRSGEHRRSPERGKEGNLLPRPPGSTRSTPSPLNVLDLPSPPAVLRRQSALHADVPAEALGIPPVPDFEELKRTNSVPDILHILIVEDNLVNQKVLAKQLRKLGCAVSVANHGLEALDFLKRTKQWNHVQHSSRHTGPPALTTCPDELPLDLSLILMDWEMPIMNGLTAVTKIRELERKGVVRGHIPVIGVTANVRVQQIQTAIDAGMDDVVSKPFRVPELMDRMRTVVANVADGTALLGRVLESIREGEG